MKLLAIPLVILGVLVACDGNGGGPDLGVADTGNDTGTDLDTDTPPTETNGMGTQVGSEGFWGCPIELVTVVDGATALDAIGGPPDELTGRVVGGWGLQIVDDGASEPVAGSLALVDAGNYLWLDVADGEGCVDHLASEVSATLVRGTTTTVLTGFVGIGSGAARLLVTAGGALDDVALTWGPSTYPPDTAVTFRIDGDLTPVGFSGAASWVDCDPLEWVCGTADPVAAVDGAR